MLQINAQAVSTVFGVEFIKIEMMLNKLLEHSNAIKILDFFIALAYNTNGGSV